MFWKAFSWKNRSLSNAKWFCAKETQNLKGNLKLTKVRPGRNEISCAEDNHNCISNYVQKILRSELWLTSNWQNIDFSRNCPNFTNSIF